MTQPKIDIKQTQAVKSSTGGQVFQEGFILRKASKLLTGTMQDALIPIPVFFDVVTGEILQESIPKELQAEFTTK